MNIKSEEELSNILGMAFANYANRVSRGEIAPYKAFLEGKETVTVQISFSKGAIQVENPFVTQPEPIVTTALEAEKESQKTYEVLKKDFPDTTFVPVIESPVLEATKIEQEPTQSEDVEVLDQKTLEENKVIITKRKRKKPE
jgi:hypothetical protein